MNENKTNINWYPGHMAKTKRLISEKYNLIDIIYEVIDARIPASSKIKDIDELIMNKPRILIMTKSDLADPQETKKWISYYEEQGYHVLALDLTNNNLPEKLINLTHEIMSEVQSKREDKGLKEREIRALVVGIPNVGKSTLINRLAGHKAAVTGNNPGVTKQLTWLKTSSNILLLDSPGILWPKLDNEEQSLNIEDICCTLLVSKFGKSIPINVLHPSNIPDISIAFLVLNDDKSKDFKLELNLNIYDIFSTFSVFKFNFKEVKDLQELNI